MRFYFGNPCSAFLAEAGKYSKAGTCPLQLIKLNACMQQLMTVQSLFYFSMAVLIFSILNFH